MINDFDFVRPETLSEALEAMARDGSNQALAGGTNVMVNMKLAPLKADCLVDLTGLEELKSISEDQGQVRLGAGVTFTDLLAWRPGGAVEGLLHPMCEGFAGPLIRNLATVGGNICDASAAADLSPVLLALDATVELQSAGQGVRTLSAAEFFQGVRQTARRSDELMTAVSFEQPGADEKWFYYKLGKRKADAISIVSVAMTVSMDDDRVDRARIGLGAVAPVAIRCPETESMLAGQSLDDELIDRAAAKAASEASPIDDFRSGADYRRNMVTALVARGLREIAAG